jgi:hypothetical protein
MAGVKKVKISKAALSYLLAVQTAHSIMLNDGKNAMERSWSWRKIQQTTEDNKRLFMNEAMGLVWDDD